jgi:hypothetical protein
MHQCQPCHVAPSRAGRSGRPRAKELAAKQLARIEVRNAAKKKATVPTKAEASAAL